MDPIEITRVIDGVYKNILDNFNPASRQMIATGKAYLKSLHGASAACSLYLDSMTKLSKQAQQHSSLGNASDIGASLAQITDVFREIHASQLNTLKAFYVDVLVPLESNLDKDARAIQGEQKKFIMCHKQRIDSFNKAAQQSKKIQRKKSKKGNNSSNALDKEIKVMQNLEEERSKLEGFCEQSMRQALTQERRRYGFILERQTSLAKHYLNFYSKGNSLLGEKLNNWMKVAKSREILPESLQSSLLKRIQGDFDSEDECIYCNPNLKRPADDTVSISSQLRKTKSMDANEILHCLKQNDDSHQQPALNRAKSDMALCRASSSAIEDMTDCSNNSAKNQQNEENSSNVCENNSRPKSLSVAMSLPPETEVSGSVKGYVKALYAYLSSGENQLCFLENDTVALLGERKKGWHFGENIRTKKTGWFPLAYTTEILDGNLNGGRNENGSRNPPPMTITPLTPASCQPPTPYNNNKSFAADIIVHRTPDTQMIKEHKTSINSGTSSSSSPGPQQNQGKQTMIHEASMMIPPTSSSASGSASDSLHSSNDSGFSNDMINGVAQKKEKQITPVQPDIDYSDDEPHQSSSSMEQQFGDEWLMKRYQISESMRLGQAEMMERESLKTRQVHRRRSLSFGNASGRDVGSVSVRFERCDDDRGDRTPIRRSASRNMRKNGESGGAFKKLISRTKSLIWKRPADVVCDGEFDSVSVQENTCAGEGGEDIWASHHSIVGCTPLVTIEMSELTKRPPVEKLVEKSSKNEQQTSMVLMKIPSPPAGDVPPPPPPLLLGSSAHPTHINRPKMDSPPSTMTTMDSETCMIIKDHMMRPMNKKNNKISRIQSEKLPPTPLEIEMQEKRTKNHISLKYRKLPVPGGQGLLRTQSHCQSQSQLPATIIRATQISRIESFSGDSGESPIVPMMSSSIKNSISSNSNSNDGNGKHKLMKKRSKRTSSDNGSRKSGSNRVTSFGRSFQNRYFPNSTNTASTSNIGSTKPKIVAVQSKNCSKNNSGGDSFNTTSNTSDEESVCEEIDITLNGPNEEFEVDNMSNSVFIEPEILEMDIANSNTTSTSKGPSNASNSNSASTRAATPSQKISKKSKKSSTASSSSKLKSQSCRISASNKNPSRYSGLALYNGGSIITPVPNHHRIPSGANRMEMCQFGGLGSRSHGRGAGLRQYPRNNPHFKGSIRSEFHHLELIADHSQPMFDYSSHLHRRLYLPERNSRIDQKSERGGNYCGPWGYFTTTTTTSSGTNTTNTAKSKLFDHRMNFIENRFPTLRKITIEK